MTSRIQKNHIGIHYKKANNEAVSGTEVNFNGRPSTQKGVDLHTKKVFAPIEAGNPKAGNGEKHTSNFKVYGGCCGKECDTRYDDFSEGFQITNDAGDNTVAECQARSWKPEDLPGDNEVFNFPPLCPDGAAEDDNQAPVNIGTLWIKNLGSQLPTYGYAVEGSTINTNERVPADPIAPVSGDWLYWGLGRAAATPDQTFAGGAYWDELECDCSGVPKWYATKANKDPNLGSDVFDPAGGGYTWTPCSSGCRHISSGGVGSYDCYDRTYWCSGVVWMGRLKPGEVAVYDLAPDSGVTLKFIAGPGFYTRDANAGLAINGLYRDCRIPSCDAEVTMFPETNA